MSRILFILVLSITLLSLKAVASPEPQLFQFTIKAQPLSQALIEFANTSNSSYIASGHLLKNKQAPQLNSKLTPKQAISQLLQGSNLTFKKLKDGTFIVLKPQVKKQINKPDTPKLVQQIIEEEPIEVILVRSTKRTDTAQDTPISANVISSDTLSRQGITHTRNLTSIAQSLSYHGAITSAGQGMRIRGVGSGIIATGIEQSVGTIIDDVVTGPSGSGLQTLWDISHIEILRGPQGTLFGKNVSAGAINNITAEPTDYFKASFSVEKEFNYQQDRFDAMLSGPLSENLGDKLTARLALFGQQQSKGTVNNIVRNEPENINEQSGIRLKLNYQDDNWWSKFSLSYSQTDDRCCARVFTHIDQTHASAATKAWVLPAIEQYQIDVLNNNRTAIAEGQLIEQQQTWHSKFEWGKKFTSGHTLKAISGYRNWQHNTQNDGDNLGLDVVSFVADTRKLQLFSQELQWLSPADDKWEYILGAYYYQQHFPSTEYIGGGLDIAGFNGITTVDSDIDVKNIALFGHSTYYLTEQTAAFSGLRLLRETSKAKALQQGNNWIWPTNYQQNTVKTADNNYTATLGLQHWFANDNQIYTSISRGYKGKAIDNSSNSILYRAPQSLANGTILTAEDAILNPETVVNIELGSKNRFKTANITFNATLFYSQFNDFQAAAYDGNSNSFRLTNAGIVKSQGLEFELKTTLWQDSKLYLSSSYIDATFKEFNGAPCQISQSASAACSAATGGQNLSGKPVNENPKWQHFISLQQAYYFSQNQLLLGASYAWRDDVIYDADLDPNTTQSAYGLLNLSASYNTEHWQLTAFVNNATNEHYATRIIDAPIWRGAYQSYPAKGKSFGVRLGYLW